MAANEVELHEEAVAESHAAHKWYEARNVVAAEAFMEELDHAVEQIGKFPSAGAPYVGGTRRHLMKRFPFSVGYRERNEKIQVLAVAHNRRRPGYWRSRIKL